MQKCRLSSVDAGWLYLRRACHVSKLVPPARRSNVIGTWVSEVCTSHYHVAIRVTWLSARGPRYQGLYKILTDIYVVISANYLPLCLTDRDKTQSLFWSFFDFTNSLNKGTAFSFSLQSITSILIRASLS